MLTKFKDEHEVLTAEELKTFKAFGNCTEQELQEEVDFINTISKVLYDFLLKTN